MLSSEPCLTCSESDSISGRGAQPAADGGQASASGGSTVGYTPLSQHSPTAILDQDVILLHAQHHQEHHQHHLVHQVTTPSQATHRYPLSLVLSLCKLSSQLMNHYYQEPSPSQQNTQDYSSTAQMFPLLRHLLPSLGGLPHRHGPDGAVRQQGENDPVRWPVQSVCLSFRVV